MKPHKHAELIKAWADGAEIQQRNFYYAPRKWSEWLVFNGTWIDDDSAEYRIKPEPKADVVSYLCECGEGWHLFRTALPDRNVIKVICDSNGKLKSAEVLK